MSCYTVRFTEQKYGKSSLGVQYALLSKKYGKSSLGVFSLHEDLD
jgi:hypothetical protein